MKLHSKTIKDVTDYIRRTARVPVLIVPSSNGMWLPATTSAQREKNRIYIARLKRNFEMLPGAADLQLTWQGKNGVGATCFAEIKTGADIQSLHQIDFEGDARAVSAEYFIIHNINWDSDTDAVLDYIHRNATTNKTGKPQATKTKRLKGVRYYGKRPITSSWP